MFVLCDTNNNRVKLELLFIEAKTDFYTALLYYNCYRYPHTYMESLRYRTLHEAAMDVLLSPSSEVKSEKTRRIAKMWKSGEMPLARDDINEKPLDKPRRETRVEVVDPASNKLKLGNGRSEESRKRILHSLTHIESWAIDLSWEVVARFGEGMPRAFFDDFVGVAEDEARHHEMLVNRLKECGASYGDYAVHDGLWESAEKTSDSLEK